MLKTLLFVTLIGLQYQQTIGDTNEDDWIDPHDWSQHNDIRLSQNFDAANLCNKCSSKNQHTSNDELVSLIYFRKLISLLFDTKQLKYDKEMDVYRRSLLFTILPGELDELQKLKDPRDLDIILSKVFANTQPLQMSDNGYYSAKRLGMTDLIWDIIKDLFQLLKISEIQFSLIAIGALTLGWFIHRRYRIRIIVVILGGVFLFGYFTTYFECNRKLEAEQFISEVESLQVPSPSWFGNIMKFLKLSDSKEEIQKTNIRKKSVLKLAYCRPDHVLLMYFNDLFMKQLESLLEKCSTTLVTLKSGLSFPYNYMASLTLVIMIGYILKLTFKYLLSPRAWAALLHGPSQSFIPPKQQILENNDVRDDRISGENLRLLLNVVANKTEKIDQPSGVQELLEQLEMPSSNTSSKSNSPNTSATEESITKEVALTDNNNHTKKCD